MSLERERVKSFGRLEDGLRQASDWYLWGPYVSERQWGTVREDYSGDRQAWLVELVHWKSRPESLSTVTSRPTTPREVYAGIQYRCQ